MTMANEPVNVRQVRNLLGTFGELTRRDFESKCKVLRIFEPFSAVSVLVRIGEAHRIPPNPEGEELICFGPRPS